MEIYTVGFTKKNAADFFEILKRNKIKRLLDVRLNNQSQLAGFTKLGNIEYFLQEICKADYIHRPILSPTKEILDSYKKKEIAWWKYEELFIALLSEREVEKVVDKELFAISTVLLCSEPKADFCLL